MISVVSEVPWAYRNLDDYNYLPRSETQIMSTAEEAKRIFAEVHGPGYLIVTRSQIAFGHLFGGLPSDWAYRLVAQLLATGEFRRVYQNSQSEVLLRLAQDGAR